MQPSLGRVGRDAVHRREERHRPVVGHHRSGEAPLIAQHLSQQPGIRAGRDAVDIGIRVHHRSGAGRDDGRLERRKDDIEHLAPTHRYRPVVARRARCRVAGEVLHGGEHAGALQPTHVGRAEHRDEIGILAHRLLDSAPAVVAHDVKHGGQTLMHTERGHVSPDRRRHLLHQRGVERRRPGDSGRIHGRPVGGEPGQAFLVHERGNAQPRRIKHHVLLAHQLGRALRGGHRCASVDPSQMPEAVPARLLQ